MAKMGKQPIPPGLQTRKANKEIHPGIAAGVAPRSCASHTEMQQKRQHQEQEKIVHANLEAEARAWVAALEDHLQQEETQCNEEANHPPLHQGKVFRPRITSTVAREASRSKVVNVSDRPIAPMSASDENSSEEDYQPPSKGEDDPDDNALEEDIDGELVERTPPVKRGKKSKVRHQDISALRMATASSILNTTGKRKAVTLPAIPTKKKTKKNSSSGAIDAGWLSAHRHSGRQLVATLNKDNDSLVKMGGILDDDEDDNVEREAMLKAPIALERLSMVKITQNHNPNVTQTEL
ncbi:hypothetical protein C0992_004677 [Termitomyces sp. T32_za158]|nr:hypothetical protein C0992_004677 [Termitomyces sp. T32_za158]